MASLVQSLEVGPVHIVGTSTGGAIGQSMALQHAPMVRSLTMASSFARFDSYTRREFDLRRKLMQEADIATVYSCYALFLFSPKFASRHPELVEAWVKRAASEKPEREISVQRIDMIAAHNVFEKLTSIKTPSLVLCGDCDFCTPLHLSEEIANRIPGAEFVVLKGGGHFIHIEQEDKFFDTINNFLNKN